VNGAHKSRNIDDLVGMAVLEIEKMGIAGENVLGLAFEDNG
jgi:hypothetical protein